MNRPAGNEKARALLHSSIVRRKVASAYLFSGIDGVGKKLHALEFARMLNCSAGPNACGECPACQKIDRSIHPDVRVYSSDAKFIKIDMIRELQTFSQATPFEGAYRVAIIDDAHKMNPFAANALLKTLEEPPSRSIIVLVTAAPKNLLPTILSRCIKVSFAPLDEGTMRAALAALGHDAGRIDAVVPLSGGSMRTAAELLQEELFGHAMAVREFVGVIEKKSFSEIGAFADKLVRDGLESLFFRVLHAHFHDGVITALASPQAGGLYRMIDGYEKTVKFNHMLRYNLTRSFLLETLLIKLKRSEAA